MVIRVRRREPTGLIEDSPVLVKELIQQWPLVAAHHRVEGWFPDVIAGEPTPFQRTH